MKKNTLVIALAAVLFSSCNMDFYPVSSIDDSTAIRSVEDAQKVANYFNIRLRGLYAGSYIYSSEIATDIFHPTIGYGNRGGDYFRWEMTSETGICESLWASCYASISNANYLIAKIDELDKTDLTEAELAKLDGFVGEAAFLKAVSTYALVEKYSPAYNASTASTDLGVMLVNSYAPTSDQSKYPPRSSMADTYKYIEDNIAIAEAKVKNPNIVASELITPDAVAAFKARVALSKKDYATAAAVASALVDSGRYPLIDAKSENAAENWTNLWKNDSGDECIVQLYASYKDKSTPNSLTYGYYGKNNVGVYAPDFIPETEVVEMYTGTDLRASWFEPQTITVAGINGDVYLFNKFPGNPALQDATAPTSSYIQKIKPFRIAEQYLIAAEAYALSGDEVKAAKYYNALAMARDPQAVETRASGDALVNAIRIERFKELIGEGFRFYDLKRYGQGMTRSDIQNSDVVFQRGTDLSIAADDYRWLWPIPQAEIDSNPQVKPQQNPGYTK